MRDRAGCKNVPQDELYSNNNLYTTVIKNCNLLFTV